jgi:hypothetical protein
MTRITEKDLQAVCNRINRTLNMPLQPYELQLADGDKPSKYVAQIGCYHLSHAYGGVALHRMYNDGGGVSDVFGGHMPKRELYGKMHAFLAGLDAAKVQS